MFDVQLTSEALKVGRKLRPPKTFYYEEIESAQSIGGKLRLVLRSGREIGWRVGTARAAELATEVNSVLEGPSCRFEQCRSPDDLTAIISAWTSSQGFAAAPFVDFVLEAAARFGASDFHVEPDRSGYRFSTRIDGVLHDLGPLRSDWGRRVLGRLKVLAGVIVHRDDIVQEGRINLPSCGEDIRLSFVPSVHGESATARLFDRLKTEAELDHLGFGPDTVRHLKRLLDASVGLVLFAGASASGKTTTLYTAVRYLMSRAQKNLRVVTVEDPVESRLSTVLQLEVDETNGSSYAHLLRSVLRQDANVIVVGEIRDPETARLASRASLTGHLVLSTVHAGTAPEALLRLLELGVAPTVLASAVAGVLAQKLVPVPCSACDGGGCAGCDDSGSDGRNAIGELLLVSSDIRDQLLRDPTLDHLYDVAAAGNMIPMDAGAVMNRSG